MPACWEFITFNLLFVLLFFVLLRCGHCLLKRFKISKYLRAFSTWLYLTPLLLDGNLQYFCFLLFSQVSLGFSLNPRDKALNVLSYIIYFFIIWISVVSCFLAYWLSRRVAKYILGNWRTRLHGLLACSMINISRALVLGGIHSLLRSHSIQLPLLLGCEVSYIVFLLLSMSFWKAH